MNVFDGFHKKSTVRLMASILFAISLLSGIFCENQLEANRDKLMEWYYAEDGKQIGPVSGEQFAELVRAGKIMPDTLVWHEGLIAWQPCVHVAGTMGRPKAHDIDLSDDTTIEAVCAECGKIFKIDDMITYGNARVCIDCKPAFLKKLSQNIRPQK